MAEPHREPARAGHYTSDPTQPYAALDLGSNSFHLIVAQDQPGRLQVVDRHREMVRLAEGLSATGELSPEVLDRALKCLERFGQRLRDLPPHNVRVVGTNTLRAARNSNAFMEAAEAVLGHKIEIISGREEARLIYLGVSHSLEDDHDSRLVIDIGGGSTELILGRRFQPRLLESLHMGCVAMSDAFFPDGKIKSAAFKDAKFAARREIAAVEHSFRAHGWDTAIGASGTINAIHGAVGELFGAPSITRETLKHLERHLLAAKNIDAIGIDAVNKQREPVFPGGVAILAALFEALEIDTMTVSDGALREGLLHDLLGRVHEKDIRENTIYDLMSRYHVDTAHAERVARTALDMFDQVDAEWRLDREDDAILLRWAASLHELGMDISHSSYHKHGGYLVENMDMPGFSRHEQQRLSMLVRTHRRKFRVDELDVTDTTVKLSILLRLSIVLHRGRTDDRVPNPTLSAAGQTLHVALSKKWLTAHPLTRLDLEQESKYLTALAMKLEVSEH